MKFQTLSYYVLALMAAVLLAACGGGGADRNPNQGGPISVVPETGTFYAGQPATITVAGGRRPYSITSSEPGILPVPPIVDGNSFQVVPNNPGVVDVGLPPGSLPVRTVLVSVRDSTGILVTATIKVAQNYLTGYGMSFGASTCAANPPCRGGETAIIFDTTTNGSLHGDKTYKIQKVRGPYQFVDPLNSTNLVDSVTITSDHEGKIVAIIRATGGTVSEISVLTVTEVVSGVNTERVFVINTTSATATLTLLPATINLVGADATHCGTGAQDVLVLDGQAPYVAFNTDAGIFVEAVDATHSPGRFRVTVVDSANCKAAVQVIFQDASGTRATLTVTTTKGAAGPAAPALAISPNTMTLTCGGSGTITVVGGSGVYSSSSNHPKVTAVAAGNSVTVTRAAIDGGGGPFPLAATVTITDGATFQNASITLTQANCP